MQFLLYIDVSLPADMPAEQLADLRVRENARSTELMRQRVMRRIWRVVGRVANYSVWEVDSLEALHQAVGSLPMFPYMKIDVTPIVKHPVTEAYETSIGELPAF
jgi:muconolactone D-isomerase